MQDNIEVACCSFTGRQNCRCFVIQNKSKQQMHVHVKLFEFAENLWEFIKMEQIVKSYAKSLIEQYDGDATLQDLCHFFDERKDHQLAMQSTFLHSYEHVVESLSRMVAKGLGGGEGAAGDAGQG